MTYSGYVVLLYNTICDPLEWRDRVNELGFAERFQMELRCKADTAHYEHLVVFLWASLVFYIILYLRGSLHSVYIGNLPTFQEKWCPQGCLRVPRCL